MPRPQHAYMMPDQAIGTAQGPLRCIVKNGQSKLHLPDHPDNGKSELKFKDGSYFKFIRQQEKTITIEVKGKIFLAPAYYLDPEQADTSLEHITVCLQHMFLEPKNTEMYRRQLDKLCTDLISQDPKYLNFVELIQNCVASREFLQAVKNAHKLLKNETPQLPKRAELQSTAVYRAQPKSQPKPQSIPPQVRADFNQDRKQDVSVKTQVTRTAIFNFIPDIMNILLEIAAADSETRNIQFERLMPYLEPMSEFVPETPAQNLFIHQFADALGDPSTFDDEAKFDALTDLLEKAKKLFSSALVPEGPNP